MTVSLLNIAKQRLTEVFKQQQSGICVMVDSKKVSRTDLAAWILDVVAGDTEPSDNFAALYINDQRQQLDYTVTAVREARIIRTGNLPDEIVLLPRAKRLPKLANFTYGMLQEFTYLQDQVSPGQLDLLVLDERHMDSMTTLRDFVACAKPTITVVICKRRKHSPWAQFGKPLVLNSSIQPGSRARQRNRRRK